MTRAQINACDRCGHREETDTGWVFLTISKVGSDGITGTPIDLCSACAERLERFIGPRNPYLAADSFTRRSVPAPKHGE